MSVCSVLSIVGRVLIGGIYVASGIAKFPEWEQTLQIMRAEGIPRPEIFLIGAIILMIGGGLSVILGWKARIGALALAIFTLAAMILVNHFWTMPAPRAEDIMHLFFANVVMLGACLFICGNGPGAWALDNRSK
jgi:putative oxidoreductase